MSAIAGIYQLHDEPVNIQHGSSIMEYFKRFPSDDIRTWSGKHIFLGCHAQWITPESIYEILPYYDHERQLAITADAIIDNRDELFERLQVDRTHRKRITDSELILLAYEKWEDEAPTYLIGDFVFMIWDERRNRLFGARDFSGLRTLYFCRNETCFAFSTTIQPLFTLPCIHKVLNEHWLAQFLAIPGMVEAVDVSSTAYLQIEQIPPSHSISVSNGKVTLSRYCRLSNVEPLKLKSNEEYEEAFREVFLSAVGARLRTYRNVGAHLSGGLDSSTVVSFAARALSNENKRLHTFSYVPEADFVDWTTPFLLPDERPYIRSTVEYVGNITDHYLDFERKNPLSEVNELLDILEMPYKYFENSFWMRGIYERAQQEGVALLLNGARGNFTISWGSAWEHYAKLLRRLQWTRLYREVNLFSQNLGADKRKVWSFIGKKALPFANRKSSSQNTNPMPMLIHPALAQKTDVFRRLRDNGIDATGAAVESAYEVRKNQFEQLYYWNKNGTFGTKLSLRHSLWDRDPTNDIRVVRFCLSVPDAQYVQNGYDRALIRRSTRNYLPDKVRLNQRIRGVQSADVIHRMQSSWQTFIQEMNHLASDDAVSELLNVEVIRAAIDKLGNDPRPEYVFDPNFKLLTRSLIVYRFLKKFS
jgi:asparagine synthase (glutamine-hydrolysing)